MATTENTDLRVEKVWKDGSSTKVLHGAKAIGWGITCLALLALVVVIWIAEEDSHLGTIGGWIIGFVGVGALWSGGVSMNHWRSTTTVEKASFDAEGVTFRGLASSSVSAVRVTWTDLHQLKTNEEGAIVLADKDGEALASFDSFDFANPRELAIEIESRSGKQFIRL